MYASTNRSNYCALDSVRTDIAVFSVSPYTPLLLACTPRGHLIVPEFCDLYLDEVAWIACVSIGRPRPSVLCPTEFLFYYYCRLRNCIIISRRFQPPSIDLSLYLVRKYVPIAGRPLNLYTCNLRISNVVSLLKIKKT